MKTIKAGLWASVAALAALSVACGGSDDNSGGNSADVVTAPPSANTSEIAPGEYVFHGNGVGATLTIKAATATTLAYEIGIQVGSHIGELKGRSATRPAGRAAYADRVDGDCEMTLLSVKADTIDVKQNGACDGAGFGAFVDGSGKYVKKTATTPAPQAGSWVGLYETETTNRAWAIRITSQSPLTFSVFAGHLENSASRVDAKGLVGELRNDSVFFQKGADCTIQMTKDDSSIHVTQTGTCAEIGFPADNDLSMSDDQGVDFSKLDEKNECFDKSKLAVASSANACKSPF